MRQTGFFVLVTALLLFSYSPFADAQNIGSDNTSKQDTNGITQKDAANGIKEALINATRDAVKNVSVVNGFYGNPEIKITLPGEAGVIEEKLRSVGLGGQVDEVILSINRAAEDAAKEAKPIFITAIKNLTIVDGLTIIAGEKDAATRYLKQNTSAELTKKFKPHIQTSLNKVEATKRWEKLVKTYNRIPLVEKLNPDLADYVTSQAIDGLFVMVAKEELKIRKDPLARTTELLQKVFGGK